MRPTLSPRAALRYLLCPILSAAMACLGLPAPAFAQTPQLLREQEPVRSAAECAALLKHVDYLNSPNVAKTLQAAYDKVKRLENQLATDAKDVDEAFKKEMWDQGLDIAKDLTVEGMKSRTIEMRQAAALHAKSPSDLIWFRDKFVPGVEKVVEGFDEISSSLENVSLISQAAGNVLYSQGVKDAGRAAKATEGARKSLAEKANAASEQQADLTKEFREMGLMSAGEKLAELGGPLGVLAFKIAYLDVTLALNLADQTEANLANVRASTQVMGDQLHALELDRSMQHVYRDQYKRDCQPRTQPEQQAQVPAPPPTIPPAVPPAEPAAKGVVGAMAVAGGLIAAAAAVGLAVAAAGAESADGSGPSCGAGFRGCVPPDFEVCCPTRFTIYCRNNNTCTNSPSLNNLNPCGPGNNSFISVCQ